MKNISVSSVPKCKQCCAWPHHHEPPVAGFWVTSQESGKAWPACTRHAAELDSRWDVELHPFGNV